MGMESHPITNDYLGGFIMKPEFINAIAATSNPGNNEVVLQFSHKYPESNEREDGVMETYTVSSDVASVVMTTKSAEELRGILNQILG